jgi:hypothetical protein
MTPRPAVRDRSPGSGPAADPALELLRGGLRPTLVAGVALVTVVAFAGGRAAVSAVVGVGLAGLAMSAGPVTMRATRKWSPPAVMAVALISYGTVVIVLGVVYVALRQVAWVSAGHLAASLIVSGAAWTAGELQAARRLRVLAFGDLAAVTDPPSTGGDEGFAGPGQPGWPGPELPKAH